MDALAFEWDSAKAAATFGKYGVSFEEAATAFQAPLARIHADPDHSALEPVRSSSAIPQDKRMQLTSLTAAPGRRERRLVRPSGLTGGAPARSLSRVLGGPGVEYRRRGTRRRMMSWRMLVLAGIACCLGSVSAATEPGVRPVGVYPFALPGLMASPDARPKALLWCQGANLMGVVVPDDKGNDCGTASPKRSAPGALLLRDGRCESDGATVSFGFLVPRKAWVYKPSRRRPLERTVWLLHRFEGLLKAGQLKGALVQVDINHPGYAFQKTSVEAEALPEEQTSFTDEAAWRGGIARTFCLAAGEP